MKLAFLAPVAALWTKHDRAILTGVTIGGTILSVAIALKDRPKYEEILWECEEDDLTRREKAGALLPAAAPLLAAVGITIGAAVWNHVRSGKKITSLTDNAASLLNAYTIGKTIQDEYRAKVGDEEADKIERRAAEKRAEKSWNDSNGSPDVVVTGHGNDLFYDDWTGTFFYSNWNFIQKVVMDYDETLNVKQRETYIGYDEILRDWGWKQIPGCARDGGWNIDDGRIELCDPEGDFSEDLGKSYTIVRFRKTPSSKYERVWH